MFSKTFGYALRAVVFVAHRSTNGQKSGIHDIAEELKVPQHFLAKILQDIVRQGILSSTKGPNGGFFPNEKTESTTLLEILKITDGASVFSTCALGIEHCNSLTPCPLHHDFAQCRSGLEHIFTQKTVGYMVAEVEAGISFLGR